MGSVPHTVIPQGGVDGVDAKTKRPTGDCGVDFGFRVEGLA